MKIVTWPASHALSASLLMALLLPAVAMADDVLTGVLARIAARGGGKALFVETQYLSVLKRPQESSGELLFAPPDHLEKLTLAPKQESVVVDKDRLTFVRNGKSRSMSLSAYPQVGVFIESIRATLAGDRSALERNFQLDFSGDDAAWKLSLEPRDGKLTAILQRIHITGREGVVDSFEMFRADGDRSVIRVTLPGA
jgi:outer membrane lipoprotein-sorting protein